MSDMPIVPKVASKASLGNGTFTDTLDCLPMLPSSVKRAPPNDSYIAWRRAVTSYGGNCTLLLSGAALVWARLLFRIVCKPHLPFRAIPICPPHLYLSWPPLYNLLHCPQFLQKQKAQNDCYFNSKIFQTVKI